VSAAGEKRNPAFAAQKFPPQNSAGDTLRSERKTMAQKKKQRKRKRTSAKGKAKAKAKAGVRTKPRAGKLAKKRFTPKKRRVTRSGDVLEVRGIETVPLSAVKPKARTARVGGGSSDYVGVSPVESADAESPRELLEEGQTFEAEVVSGVQNAPPADQSEVKTHEVPEDDVPPEYLDPDRP
jgi:hypothetical protein